MSEHENMPVEQMFSIQQMVAAMTRTTCENECGNCNVCHLSIALAYEKFMRRGDVAHINACSNAALRKVKRVEAERDAALAAKADCLARGTSGSARSGWRCDLG